VHDFGTCKENAAAQCRLLTNLAAKHVFMFPENKNANARRLPPAAMPDAGSRINFSTTFPDSHSARPYESCKNI